MKSRTSFALLFSFAFPVLALSAELTGKVLVADRSRGLAGAIVYVVSAVPEKIAPSRREVIKLMVRGGRLDPQVFVVQAGESFTISNADADNYNLHVQFRKNPERNLALVGNGQSSIKTERPELFARVSEDLGRLHGYICVMEHPVYAVTDAAGAFKLPDLPAGSYTIESVHPREGRLRRELKFATANMAVDFALPGGVKSLGR